MARKARRQVAALPLGRCADGTWQVLLVTSRETGRWIVPKGWIEPGRSPRQQAAQEAFEESGVKGVVGREPIGAYRYEKLFRGRWKTRSVACEVTVYLLFVQARLEQWPEKEQRASAWMSPEAAAGLVDEPGLAAIILGAVAYLPPTLELDHATAT